VVREVSFRLSTGCKALDDALHGGFKFGTLNSFEGRPGRGKTAFCLTIALDAAARGVKSFYIDADAAAGVDTDRLVTMLNARNVEVPAPPEVKPGMPPFKLMKLHAAKVYGAARNYGVDVRGASTPQEILARVGEAVKAGVPLIILDSLTLFYKDFCTVELSRGIAASKAAIPDLVRVVTMLSRYAKNTGACVVFTMQRRSLIGMENRLKKADRDREHIGPDNIGHHVNAAVELVLNPQTNERFAKLYKFRGGVETVVPFKITDRGVE